MCHTLLGVIHSFSICHHFRGTVNTRVSPLGGLFILRFLHGDLFEGA